MIKIPNPPLNYGDSIGRLFGHMAKTITFIVTHNCNMNCSYCYEHHKSSEKMSFEVAKKAIDLLFLEDEHKSIYINPEETPALVFDFIGGEPFIEIELIDQILDYFLYTALDKNHRWAEHFMISMSSNGVLYFSPEVQKFMDKWYGRLNISITIDGNKELHDSCRRLVSGEPTYELAAAAFADARIRYNQSGTKLTISPDNLKYLSTACIDMIQKFDLEYLFGNPIFEAQWTNQDALLYYEELKKIADWLITTGRWEKTGVAFFNDFIGHKLPESENNNWCGGTGAMLAIDIDGSLYPCLRYAPLSMGNELSRNCVIGHVNTGLTTQECEKCFMDSLCEITRRSQSNDECWNCPIGSGCATCSAWQYEFYGTANKRCTHICPMHKARVMATSYFYNTLYRKYCEPDRFKLNIPKEWALEIIDNKEYEMLVQLSQEEEDI